MILEYGTTGRNCVAVAVPKLSKGPRERNSSHRTQHSPIHFFPSVYYIREPWARAHLGIKVLQAPSILLRLLLSIRRTVKPLNFLERAPTLQDLESENWGDFYSFHNMLPIPISRNFCGRESEERAGGGRALFSRLLFFFMMSQKSIECGEAGGGNIVKRREVLVSWGCWGSYQLARAVNKRTNNITFWTSLFYLANGWKL